MRNNLSFKNWFLMIQKRFVTIFFSRIVPEEKKFLMTDPCDVRMVDLHSPAPTANTPYY